jgi:hypothetical protein
VSHFWGSLQPIRRLQIAGLAHSRRLSLILPTATSRTKSRGSFGRLFTSAIRTRRSPIWNIALQYPYRSNPLYFGAMDKLLPILGAILCAAFHVSPLDAQIRIQDLQTMGGPWECADSDGIHGFSVDISTYLSRSDRQSIDWQTVTFYVYQRLKEKGGRILSG